MKGRKMRREDDFNFRAYEENTGMVYFSLHHTRAIEDLALNSIIMQDTGVKDIKGNNIYEGDIVEGGYTSIMTGEFISRRYIILHDTKRGGYKAELIGSTPYGDTWLQYVEGEVIGNKFENPNLYNVAK